jgi:hypothetical protein
MQLVCFLSPYNLSVVPSMICFSNLHLPQPVAGLQTLLQMKTVFGLANTMQTSMFFRHISIISWGVLSLNRVLVSWESYMTPRVMRQQNKVTSPTALDGASSNLLHLAQGLLESEHRASCMHTASPDPSNLAFYSLATVPWGLVCKQNTILLKH